MRESVHVGGESGRSTAKCLLQITHFQLPVGTGTFETRLEWTGAGPPRLELACPSLPFVIGGPLRLRDRAMRAYRDNREALRISGMSYAPVQSSASAHHIATINNPFRRETKASLSGKKGAEELWRDPFFREIERDS